MGRVIDIIVSLIVLLLFLPLGLFIAVILKFTGEGEIFFLQDRIGKNGKIFKMFKFATMLKDSPNMGTETVSCKDDPRILPVGKFLRKTKLNEIPQFLNLLRGDMCLVGPRPLTPQTFGYYPMQIQEQLVQVKPGLTGIGSVIFRDEESITSHSSKSILDCHREDIAPLKGKLELWYIQNKSFWLDLKLILLTILAVIAPENTLYKKFFRDSPIAEIDVIELVSNAQSVDKKNSEVKTTMNGLS